MRNTLILAVLSFFFIINKSQGQSEEIVVLLEEKSKALQNNDVNEIGNLFHVKGEIRRYPNEKIAKGEDAIKDYYTSLFSVSKIKKVTLLDRMVFKGVVIDKELLETETISKERIVFYKFKKNRIKMMIILEGQKEKNSPIQIVERQLQAYNQRDIEAFVRTYARDTKVYNFAGSIMFNGLGDLRRNYSELFKNIGLHCRIEKRITMGNTVIDYEVISTNGPTFKAVAIYEVKEGLISRVSLLQ